VVDKSQHIYLRKAAADEARKFVAMENSAGTGEFIIPYSLEQHLAEMEKPEIVYLSIIANQQLAGFIIVATGEHGNGVEFRRIVVRRKGQGIGQAAISKMEQYCLTELDCNRIWLDVYDFNHRGRHLYEKLGYRYFKSSTDESKTLLYYEKLL